MRTDDALSTSPDSEQIEHTVAKPQMRNFASVEQIQDGLGRGDSQLSCKADKNFCVVFDCKSETQPFDNNKPDYRTSCENDSEYSFSPWWALPSREEIKGLSAPDGERIASRGWRVLQETKSRSKTWNCRLMRATKQVSRRDEGEMCKEVLC